MVWERLGVPQEGQREVAGKRDALATLLFITPLQPKIWTSGNEDGWMDLW